MSEKSDIHYDHEFNIETFYFQNFKQKFPCHTHSYYVIGLLECGVRRLTYKTKKYMLYPQNLLLINPGDSHCCTAANMEPMNYRALHLTIAKMKTLSSAIRTTEQLPLFSAPVVSSEELSRLFVKLHKLLIDPHSDSEEKNSSLRSFMDLLLSGYSHTNISPPKHTPKVLQAQKFIDETYEDDFTIKGLCKEINIKPATLFYYFIKELGISPRRYLITQRVNAAKELLQTMDVKFAAVETGFFDHSHLTRAFKALTGVTPHQYKNSLLK